MSCPVFVLSEREPSTTLVEESEGRRFYTLWQYLCAQAFRRIPATSREGITWDESNAQANDIEVRFVCVDSLLLNYKDIIESHITNFGREEKKLLQVISSNMLGIPRSRFTVEEISLMQSWGEQRVEGIFWLIGYTPQGAALLYPGRSEEEEAIFIVKGLSSRFTDLVSQHPDISLPGLCVKTVLLPWKGCIIYNSIFEPHFFVAKEHLEKYERSQEAIERCRSSGRVYFQLTSEICENRMIERKEGPGGSFSRHAFNALGHMNSKRSEVNGDTTAITVVQTIWNIDSTFKTPITDIQATIDTPEGVYIEGMKTMMHEGFNIRDSDTCTMCGSGKTFVSCCKAAHMERVEKSRRKQDGECLYCWDIQPLERAMAFNKANKPATFYNRMSVFNFHTTTFRLPNEIEVNELRRRLKENRPVFRTATNNFFEFLGYIIGLKASVIHGISTFGSLEIHPEKNSIEIVTHSAERASVILKEVRDCCVGLHPTDPTISSEPVSGGLDKRSVREGLGGNAQFLEKFCQGTPKVMTNKGLNAVRICGFCGSMEQEEGPKMSACSGCRRVHYCGKNCQKMHWSKGGHKKDCAKFRDNVRK